jgi:hypothetical protein
MNNGLFSDSARDNIYLYGTLVHKEIEAVHATIDTEKRVVTYQLYAGPRLLSAVAKYERLVASDGLWDMWRLKRFLKKEGNLDFKAILERFVRDFCGEKWRVDFKLENVSAYVDAPVDDDNTVDIGIRADKQPD